MLRVQRGWVWRVVVGITCMVRVFTTSPAHGVLLDDFEDLSGWSVITSEGASLKLVHDVGYSGKGMRLDFDFYAGGGYVNVQKSFSLPLPANYVFSFYVRGEAPPNNFEFKLVDPSGKNVWWRNQRDFRFPARWERMWIKKGRLEFAWGPSNTVLKHVGALEFTIAASKGGKGSVWIDEISFDERDSPGAYNLTPTVRASTTIRGHDSSHAFDGDVQTSWKSEPVGAPQWLLIDFGTRREFGGLVIDWDAENYASTYEVALSSDGVDWSSAYRTTSSNGHRDYVFLPDAEARYVKLDLERSSSGRGYGIAEITVKPFEFSASVNQFFTALARDEPPGSYPKYFYNRQTYWTVIGVDGDEEEALLNEEGMLEVAEGSFSIEPFLHVGDQLITWSDVETKQSLDGGYLPIPSVTWVRDDFLLEITAFATGAPGASILYARYRVHNGTNQTARVYLSLAIRPFQVNPPWQSLKIEGGVTPIRTIRFEGSKTSVNDRVILSLTAPSRYGAATFDQGSLREFLSANAVPAAPAITDTFGYGWGVLQYALDIEAGRHGEVSIAAPFHDPSMLLSTAANITDPVAEVEQRYREARATWEQKLNRVLFHVPIDAEPIFHAIRSTLAFALINRDGPSIQPGPRSYARCWIRDAATTVSALLETGFTQEPRDFLRWFAGYQFKDGKVPCCVDERGADPTPEHDSHGEFVYAVAEYYRHTRDVGLIVELWPNVLRAIDYLDSLRRQRLTDYFAAGEQRLFFGLLPESISHEGYASYPVHSYWDDFFALRGFKDAVFLAAVLGETEQAARIAEIRDTFRGHLYASIQRSMEKHKIDYIPGAAELGDFDPNSTAVAIEPGDEDEHLPPGPLKATFDKYYYYFQDRVNDRIQWDAYTPYEVRNIAVLVRLGEPRRAFEVLNGLFLNRRPLAWNQWPEIVWRDGSAPKFIGDMPHTWIGSSFIRSVRTMFAYERESDGALVLAAGIPEEWLRNNGVGVKRLATHYGVLNYRMRAEASGSLKVTISGDLTIPSGRIVLRSPVERKIRSVKVNGTAVETFDERWVNVTAFPAEVVIEYGDSL